jgi:hypothetical protein
LFDMKNGQVHTLAKKVLIMAPVGHGCAARIGGSVGSREEYPSDRR